MSVQHAERRTKVEGLLNQIKKIDGGWQEMLDLLYVRSVRKSLIERRWELGLTQGDLAKRLGISQAAVAEFETDPYPDPRMSTLARYACALDLELRPSLICPPTPPEEEKDG